MFMKKILSSKLIVEYEDRTVEVDFENFSIDMFADPATFPFRNIDFEILDKLKENLKKAMSSGTSVIFVGNIKEEKSK